MTRWGFFLHISRQLIWDNDYIILVRSHHQEGLDELKSPITRHDNVGNENNPAMIRNFHVIRLGTLTRVSCSKEY